VKESQSVAGFIFPIFGKPAAATEPAWGAFDNPAFGQNDKTFGLITTADDLNLELRHDLINATWKIGPL
jgi:hypothetical protein